MNNQLQEFWDNCNPNFAHIDISGHLVSLESLTLKWEVKQISGKSNYQFLFFKHK